MLFYSSSSCLITALIKRAVLTNTSSSLCLPWPALINPRKKKNKKKKQSLAREKKEYAGECKKEERKGLTDIQSCCQDVLHHVFEWSELLFRDPVNAFYRTGVHRFFYLVLRVKPLPINSSPAVLILHPKDARRSAGAVHATYARDLVDKHRLLQLPCLILQIFLINLARKVT